MLKIKILFKNILTDLLFIISFASIIYGSWLIYEPLAFIIGGICLCYLALPLKKGK